MGGEYAGETAKEFLKILQTVAEAVPVPVFGAAGMLATDIMQACDVSHTFNL